MTTANISQDILETLLISDGRAGTITQDSLEVLVVSNDRAARSTQAVLEVLIYQTPAVVTPSRGYRLLPTIN